MPVAEFYWAIETMAWLTLTALGGWPARICRSRERCNTWDKRPPTAAIEASSRGRRSNHRHYGVVRRDPRLR
jgi:hypothetical protein